MDFTLSEELLSSRIQSVVGSIAHWQYIFKCNEEDNITMKNAVILHLPMWLNYSSNQANGHVSGLNSKCSIPMRAEVEGQLCLFYYTHTFGRVRIKCLG